MRRSRRRGGSSRTFRRVLQALLGLILFGLAILVLRRELAASRMEDLLLAWKAVPTHRLVLAGNSHAAELRRGGRA